MSVRNRRIHQRNSVMAEGWIAMPPDGMLHPISTVDVSKGGFAFVSQQPVEVDSINQFRLQLPNDAGLMHVEGRIAHCVELPGSGAYRIGVQAIKVDVIDMESMLLGPSVPAPDPQLDLVFSRTIDVPREQVWAAWTTPSILKKWFTPAPWTTVECEIDLRPGGIFRTVMQSPDGLQTPHDGTYLEVVENEKLVWTNALTGGFRPAGVPPDTEGCSDFQFTVVITLAVHGKGTNYTATVLHRNQADREKHEAMGFHEGWGAALDQLVTVANSM